MSYTLKLDLTEYQRSVLVTYLRSGVDAAARDGLTGTPFPTALAEVLEQVTGYAEAVAQAKRIAAEEEAREFCGARYGTGEPHPHAEATCRRPVGHPPISVDRIGHRPTATPHHAFEQGLLGLCTFGRGTDHACAMPSGGTIHSAPGARR